MCDMKGVITALPLDREPMVVRYVPKQGRKSRFEVWSWKTPPPSRPTRTAKSVSIYIRPEPIRPESFGHLDSDAVRCGAVGKERCTYTVS